MNCTKCNTPGARYQFIDGLCHSCTAKLKNEWCLKYTELADLYSKTADELQRLKAKENEVCEWEYDEMIGAYETKCGHHWEFSSGGPTENKANFCLFCGKKIKIV